jgi:hypothetical protein
MRSIVRTLPVLALFAIVGCSSSQESVGQSSDAIDYICSESPSATLDGIPAYAYCGNFNVWSNNGADTKSSSGGTGWVQTEGGYGYQCVEYAVRYEHFKFGVATGWGNAYAYQMCANHPSTMTKATTPVHGDLIVFAPGSCGSDGTAGHVAVVDVVNATTVKVVQENVAGSYTYNRSCASCWLHATANSGTSDPCATAPSGGDYCGQSTQWGGGTKDVLYTCQNGATTNKVTCQYGCIVEPPGTNDQCAPPPADAGTDASADASTDAAPPKEAGPTQDAAPQQDAGTGNDNVGGCSTSGSVRSNVFAIGLVAIALAFIRRRRPSVRARRAR